MAYNNQDKLDFLIKDQRYSLGMSRGNSLAKAVDLLIGIKGNTPVGGDKLEEWMEMFIFKWADKFHHFNQESIEKDFAQWKETNLPRLKEELGIQDDFEKNIIQEGVKL